MSTKNVLQQISEGSSASPREGGKSSMEDEMNALLSVLNNNALVAALFLTMEVPLLLEPARERDEDGDFVYQHWRLYAQLTFATIAVILHGVCVFTACESTFVFNHVTHAFKDPALRDEEYLRFRATVVGSRVEPISGLSYIWGIVAGMLSLASRLGSADAYGSPAGDIAAVILGVCFLAIGTFAWRGVAGYVGRVHERAAQRTRRTTQRDHRGRRLTVESDASRAASASKHELSELRA